MNLETRIDGYLLRYMLQWETKQSETLLNAAKLTQPFDYRLRAHANGETRERTADVAETFNYLLGLNVRTRCVYEDDGQALPGVQRGDARGPRAQHSGHLAGDRGLDAGGLRPGPESSSPRADWPRARTRSTSTGTPSSPAPRQ